MYKILIFLFFTGCAGLGSITEGPIDPASVATGATVVKTVEKIKEVFTPKYPLLNNPQEICDITSDPVVCYVIPCVEGGNCEVHIDRSEFLTNNPKVVTIQTSMAVEVVSFCNKNPDACESYSGEYKNLKIILTKDKK